jgi:hypothetical protein
MRTGTSSYFSAEEVSWLGWLLLGPWCWVAKVADAGLRGQVSPLLPFLLFLISFFSVFYIVNLSVVLNSNILQTLLVEFKLDTLQVLKK